MVGLGFSGLGWVEFWGVLWRFQLRGLKFKQVLEGAYAASLGALAL